MHDLWPRGHGKRRCFQLFFFTSLSGFEKTTHHARPVAPHSAANFKPFRKPNNLLSGFFDDVQIRSGRGE